MLPWKKIGVAAACALAVSACESQPANPYSGVPATRDAPPACAADFARRAGELVLPPTVSPATKQTGKSEPLRIANTIAYNRRLDASARWTEFDDGWSSLALRLKSDGAKSISVHLTEATLPTGTQIWLCSPDGLTRQGPYRDVMDGELWTSVVPGSQAWLEVLVPTAQRDGLKIRLAEIFGGYD
ncbi:MAG: hypothetical protein ACRETW_15670 [Stenotrophobium sp.]